MSELAEVRARASVPEARAKSFSGFVFIGVVVEMFCWVCGGWVAQMENLENTPAGLSAMVSTERIGSMEIRENRKLIPVSGPGNIGRRSRPSN